MYIMYVPVCIFIIVYFYLGEASGKPFARVPYLRGGFEVTGLPDGIPFKKPTAYGTKTIQELMKNAEKIQFKIAEKQVGFTSSRQELFWAKLLIAIKFLDVCQEMYLSQNKIWRSRILTY